MNVAIVLLQVVKVSSCIFSNDPIYFALGGHAGGYQLQNTQIKRHDNHVLKQFANRYHMLEYTTILVVIKTECGY